MSTFTTGEYERLLLARFAPEDAMSWDNCGLLVGDRDSEITGIRFALDPTVDVIRQTREGGANVLVTHHPVMLDPVSQVVIGGASMHYDQDVIFAAIRCEVALIALHTNLDRDKAVQHIWPDLLGCTYAGPLETRDDGGANRMGQIATISPERTLEDVARDVSLTLGIEPRVWGDPKAPIRRIAFATGSGSSLVPDVLAAQVDLFCAGEVKYHSALELASNKVACIELGHDISENPLMAVVAQATHEILEARDIPLDAFELDPTQHWWTPSMSSRP